jgi:hypothetical protein
MPALRQALLQTATARSGAACELSAGGRTGRILAGGVRYAFIARLAAFLNGRRAAPRLAICSAPSVGYGQLLSR